MKKLFIWVGIVLGILLVGYVGYQLVRDTDLAEDAVRGNVITYRDHGFNPSVLRVVSGTEITIENESARDVQLSSDEHPTNAVNSELNADVLAPGESQTLLLTSRGTWGYHDHLRPSATGEIIVE